MDQGAGRRLRRLSRKDARFLRHESCCISKSIVQTAKDTGRGIDLENLEGIRGRISAPSGDARNKQSGWSFHQFAAFLWYKAQNAGILITHVDPRNISKTCSVCGHCEKANRKFRAECYCKDCGASSGADWNAAWSIRALVEGNAATELKYSEAKTGSRTAAEFIRKATGYQPA